MKTDNNTPPKPIGRRPLPPAQRSVNRSIRLRPDEWEKYERLGGVGWLRERIRAAGEKP